MANEGGIKAICKLNSSFVIENALLYVINYFFKENYFKRGLAPKYEESEDKAYPLKQAEIMETEEQEKN